MTLHILALTPGTGFQAQAWGRVLAAGVDGFLIREPSLGTRALLEAAGWCRREAPQVELWVHGRLDVALAAGCGLHAPEAHPDPPALVPLSRPLHAESQFPGRAGCAQLLVAPIHPVPGKGEAWGAARLHGFLDALPTDAPRMLALGGIRPDRMAGLAHPRLSGVALIRALWEAADPGALVRDLRTGASGYF